MAKNKRGRSSFLLPSRPVITAWASIAGKKEGQGPLAHTFDMTSQDPYFGQKTWEQAEKHMQQLALEKLAEKGAYDVYQPDVVIYDVLGDVVCGGFSMPMRGGYADKVFVITSGENMALHAAANIAMAIEGFKGRGYAQLGGVILNRRNVKNEDAKVSELAADIGSQVIAALSRSDTVQEAEELGKTVVEAFPDSPMAQEYRALAKKLMELCGVVKC